MLTAYLDESMRQTADGLYVVAAAVVMSEPDSARQAARSVMLPRRRRFHWVGEEDRDRHRMLDVMTDLELPVLGSYLRCRLEPGRDQDRPRALCLTRLLWDIWHAGVGELVIESRGKTGDQKDRRSVIGAQQGGWASSDLVYEFRRPRAEPLLWFADAAAGALATTIAGERDYLVRLPGCAAVEIFGL